MLNYKIAFLAFLLISSTLIIAQTSVTIVYKTPDSLVCQNHNAKLGFSVAGVGYNIFDSLDYVIDWGDGIKTNGKYAINRTFYNEYHTYSSAGNFVTTLRVVGSDGKRDSSITNFLVGNCKTISGKIFNDKNSNCLVDPGETFSTDVLALATELSTGAVAWVKADPSGAYSVEVPVGYSYDLSARVSSYYSPFEPIYLGFPVTCPLGGYQNINSLPASSMDMGLNCYSGFDLEPFIPYGYVRFGKTAFFPFNLNNFGCMGQFTKFQIVLSDPKLTYQSPSLPTTAILPIVKGDTLEWNRFMNASSHFSGNIAANLSSSAAIGDTVCIDVIASPSTGDTYPSNNVKQYCFPVQNSFDPNDKSASPIGIGENHKIRDGELITYTIQFQNTGNAPAFDVVLRDTLKETLNAKTLKVLGSSHEFEVVKGANNELTFLFENINLPDSGSDFIGSQGWVSYQLHTKVALPLGTKITNRAAIYFDLNPPIITNEVFHTIALPNGITELNTNAIVRFYPNPAIKKLMVELLGDYNGQLRIVDITGKVMLNQKITQGITEIALENLSKGIYLLEVNSASSRYTDRLVVLE